MAESITLGYTAGQLFNMMFGKLGVLPDGRVLTNAQLDKALSASNMMLKFLQAKGINLWRQTQVQIQLPTGVAFVTITPQVIGVEDCRWVTGMGTVNQYERPLGVFTYQEYMTLPNKNQQSQSGPMVFMYDRQRTQSNIYFWPQAQTPGTINATVVRIINTISGAADVIDIPDEWLETFVYAGARRLMTDYGVIAADPQTAQEVISMSEQGLAQLEDFDRADSIKIKPWGKRGTGRFWR